MKKLMIAAAIVCAAAFAQAASANWSGNAVTLAGADTTPTTWSVILMDSSITSQSTLQSLFAGTDKDKLAQAINDATVLTTAGAAQGTTAGRWGANGVALPSSYSQGDEVTFYTLILDNGGLKDGGNYFLAQEVSGKVSDSVALGMTFGSQASKSWTKYSVGSEPIPEPTSGLLLLLGVAGLALRRRHA